MSIKYGFFFLLLGMISCKDQTEKSIPEVKADTHHKKIEPARKNALQQKPVEDPRKVAEQFKPENAAIVHSVIQTSLWGKENSIIVFYESRYTSMDEYQDGLRYPHEYQYVDAYLLIPDEKNEYEKVLIHHFEDDNVDTEIQSVFFANADSDSQKELIILSTCVHRLQYLYEGTEYSTSVFDDFDAVKPPKKMTYLPKISAQLNGGFEGFLEENPNSQAAFKNASDIKKELKRLGY